MSDATTIEARLSSLELEVSRLRGRLDQFCREPTWLEEIAGSMQDEAEFEEVLRLGRLARAHSGGADRP